MTQTSITRRSFVHRAALAGTAMAGLSMAGGLIGCAPKTNPTPEPTKHNQVFKKVEYDKVMKTCCHGCIAHCPALAYVKDGVVVKLMGDPAAPESKGSFCVKGLNQLQTMYSPRRILHPIRRAGARGENKWEIISWDEAVEEAATHVVDTLKKYGPYAIFGSTGGGGAYSSNQIKTTCMSLGTPNVFEPGAAQCLMPRICAIVFMYGNNQSQSVADSMSLEWFKVNDNATEVCVHWGAQPSVSQTAMSGRGMADLRARGVKTIVVDPNFSPDASKADVWLPLRPGTDTALALSWFRYIFENKLYNEKFTKYWTNLPFLIDPKTGLMINAEDFFPGYKCPTPEGTDAYVCYDLKTNSLQPFEFSMPEDSKVDPEIFWMGEHNGVTYKTAGQMYKEQAEPWTLEHAGEICWLKPEKIEEAIRLYTHADNGGCEKHVAGINHGVATDQQPDSSEASIGCIGLDMIMGYINKPGASITSKGANTILKERAVQNAPQAQTQFGVCFKPGEPMSVAMARVNKAKEEQPDNFARASQLYKDGLGTTEHKGLHTWWMVHIPTVLKAIKTGEPYKPRLWWDVSGNKLAMLADATSWYNAFDQIDYCICQYPMLTSFHVECADLVFPCREWLEDPLATMPMGDQRQLNTFWLQNECTHIGETVSHCIPTAKVLARIKELYGPLPGLQTGKKGDAYIGATSEQFVKDKIVEYFGAESWKDLQDNDTKYVPKVTPEDAYYKYYQHEVIAEDGLPVGFGTESHKCEVYAQLYLKMARTGFPYCWPEPQDPCPDYNCMCTYFEPAESPLTDTEYPFVITSGRVPYFHHGTMRHSAFARELFPTAEIRINPKSAKELGIKHMDWVKVSSRRGSVSARAYLTEGVNPRTVWMERMWNPECYDSTQKKITGGWQECNINVLTKASAPYNGAIGSYTNRGFTVKIEKGTRPDNVWVEAEQFEPFLPTLMNEPITEDVK